MHIADWLWWQGDVADICVFLVAERRPDVDWTVKGVSPDEVFPFDLEDEEGTLTGASAFTWDLTFARLPDDLNGYLKEVLRRVCAEPGTVAWLGGEGSFHFDHLLSDDVARYLYGVGAHGMEPAVCDLQKETRTEVWRQELRRFRALLPLT